jgi:hypothetical protein
VLLRRSEELVPAQRLQRPDRAEDVAHADRGIGRGITAISGNDVVLGSVGDDRLVYPPPYWPDRLDEAPAKTQFWNAFKPLGQWWAELPPY